MSEVIRVEEPVYKELESLRKGEQTFSDVVKNLLKGRETTLRAMDMLEGSVHYLEWQQSHL